jgi:GAF domain-containing protein
MQGSCPLEDVIATEALDRRAPHVASAIAETRAMGELKRALAGSPRAVLQKLAEVGLELCGAQSSGVSLLEEADGRRFFRWYAVAGEWARLLWTTLPREFSPCGAVLDRQEALLMVDPERYFGRLGQVQEHVSELLLVPFEVGGQMVGTVWVIAHDAAHQFNGEDRRIVTELTRFAAIAYERLRSFKADDVRELSRMHLVSEPGSRKRV